MLNIGGLVQSASVARLENAISKEDFFFVCNMDKKKREGMFIKALELDRLTCIATQVNRWYVFN